MAIGKLVINRGDRLVVLTKGGKYPEKDDEQRVYLVPTGLDLSRAHRLWDDDDESGGEAPDFFACLETEHDCRPAPLECYRFGTWFGQPFFSQESGDDSR